MKKTLFFFLIIFYFFFGLVIFNQVKGEEIKEFDVKIHINKDGTINIREKIIYDFGNQLKHGIFREIPFIKENKDKKKFILELSDFRATDEKGSNYQFVKNKEEETIKLKIGNPYAKVSGVRTYVIYYKISGALTYFSDHDELYWNITGNNWPVVIQEATSNIFLPEGINKDEVKIDCYTGSYGVSEKNCQFYFQPDFIKDGIFLKTSRPLNQKEGLTIVVGFPKNFVAVLEPKEYKSFWETFLGRLVYFLLILGVLIWYLVLPLYIFYCWFKYGRDPKLVNTGETRAWFDPPKTPDNSRFLTPAEVGVLGDDTVDLKDISATIVDLARRGYLKIEERKKGEFWLLRNDKKESKFLLFEKNLIREFFGTAKEINLKNKNLYEAVEKVKKAIYEEVVKTGLFPDNPQKIRATMTILAFLGLITGNLFLAIIAFIFGRNLPRKTLEGVKAKNIAFSLRNFLKSQERQLAFQADKQMMFEKLLSYAIVFGVEQIWAQRFKDLDLNPPRWYQGYEQKTFNTIMFTKSLNSSLSTFRSSAAGPTPTRSTSGFSSGFSGGFSGGGGGGGGGGSW